MIATLRPIPIAKLAGIAPMPIVGIRAWAEITVITKPAIEAAVGRIVLRVA